MFGLNGKSLNLFRLLLHMSVSKYVNVYSVNLERFIFAHIKKKIKPILNMLLFTIFTHVARWSLQK